MPELPEMQALAERLEPLGFTALKTVEPPPDALVGRRVTGVGRRGKFAVVAVEGGMRMLVHLSQAGRVDVERPPKATRPRGAVVRLVAGEVGILVREHGTQRKAG